MNNDTYSFGSNDFSNQINQFSNQFSDSQKPKKQTTKRTIEAISQPSFMDSFFSSSPLEEKKFKLEINTNNLKLNRITPFSPFNQSSMIESSPLNPESSFLESPIISDDTPFVTSCFSNSNYISKETKLDREGLELYYNQLLESFDSSVRPEDVQTYLNKGGKLSIIKDDVFILERESVFTSCTNGNKRSQVLAAYLRSKRVDVKGIFAGSSLDTNKKVHFEPLSHTHTFKNVFNEEKIKPIGFEAKEPKKYFANLFQNLKPTTFLCFGESSLNILKQLIIHQNDLTDFKIIHIKWDDEIKYPENYLDVESNSTEAYQMFKDKLEKQILVW